MKKSIKDKAWGGEEEWCVVRGKNMTVRPGWDSGGRRHRNLGLAGNESTNDTRRVGDEWWDTERRGEWRETWRNESWW